MINGIGQSDGIRFAASEVVHGKDLLTMDIAPAYPKDAGITSWKRSVALNSTSDSVTITDEYSLKALPTSLQQVFMTVCDVDISTPGKVIFTTAKDKHAVLTYDANSWSIATDRPTTEGPEYSSFVEKWEKRPIIRIVLTAKNAKTSGKLEYSVRPGS